MSTRENIAKSWNAAKRGMDWGGAITANEASAAGQYLELAQGDPRRAIDLLPKYLGPDETRARRFWARVATYLALVLEEERTPLKLINGGRQ